MPDGQGGSMGIKYVALIGLTIFSSCLLTILPWPHPWGWYQPAWVFIVLLFWMIYLPDRVGVGVAFFVGLLLDLLTGTLLGQHSFAFSFIAYLCIRFGTQIRGFALWSQLIVVLVATLIYLGSQYWLMAIVWQPYDVSKYGWVIVTTLFLWPWARFLLKDFQRRFSLT